MQTAQCPGILSAIGISEEFGTVVRRMGADGVNELGRCKQCGVARFELRWFGPFWGLSSATVAFRHTFCF